MTDAEALQLLAERTYAVQHSPNCPMSHLVRLPRRGWGGLDMLPPGMTMDHLGYGKTLRAAVQAALADEADHPDAPRRRVSGYRPRAGAGKAVPPREE